MHGDTRWSQRDMTSLVSLNEVDGGHFGGLQIAATWHEKDLWQCIHGVSGE